MRTRRQVIERRTAWGVVTENGWMLPVNYFDCAPAVPESRDGVKRLLFRTRALARQFIRDRARDTLQGPRPIKFTIEVTLA